jgi:hypothetical protein
VSGSTYYSDTNSINGYVDYQQDTSLAGSFSHGYTILTPAASGPLTDDGVSQVHGSRNDTAALDGLFATRDNGQHNRLRTATKSQLPARHTVTATPPADPTDEREPHMFVNTSDPTVPVPKAKMRKVRQHVMKTHLKNKATESRLDASDTTGAKRKRAEPMTVHMPGGLVKELKSQNPTYSGTLLATQSGLTPASSLRSVASSLCEIAPDRELSLAFSDRLSITTHSVQGQVEDTRPSNSPESPTPPSGPLTSAKKTLQERTPMLMAWRYSVEKTLYYDTEENRLPLLQRNYVDLGARINAFDTWPAYNDPRVNVRQLKHHCALHFGSRGLSVYWIPPLLQSRHAFLSTLCIATAHLGAMRQIEGSLTKQESYVQTSVRHEVLTMVNAVSVTEQKANGEIGDGTITAVLQIVMGEVMNSEPRDIKLYEYILTEMVRTRGGVTDACAGGLGAHIHACLTMTIYVIAVLQEKLPDQMYRQWIQTQQRPDPNSRRPYPESPAFCGDIFVTIPKTLSPGSKILPLLDILRVMTDSLLTGDQSGLTGGKAAIDAFPAGNNELSDSQEDRRYEVLRLTAKLYATALVNKVTFSRAAALSGVSHPQIVEALRRCGVSNCWDLMAGVLFWIVLVAGAAANTDQMASPMLRAVNLSKGDAARKYLSAIAMRCSIKLGFEHAFVLLATLRRMVDIQQLLGQRFVGSPTMPTRQVHPRPQQRPQQSQQQNQQQRFRRATTNPHAANANGQLTLMPMPPYSTAPAANAQSQLTRMPSYTTAPAAGNQLLVPIAVQQPVFFGPSRPSYRSPPQQQQKTFGDFARDFNDSGMH